MITSDVCTASSIVVPEVRLLSLGGEGLPA
jgi:hypothetical protein